MSILFDLEYKKEFTSTEKTIADYILKNSDQIEDMSIADLARATHSSNASVIRLCRKVGSKGFRDFRLSFLRELEKVPEDVQRTDVNYPVYDRASPIIVMQSLADVHKFAVNTCVTSVSALDIQRAAFLIHASKHVYLLGMGESELIAQIFARRLFRIGYIPILVSSVSEHLAVTRTAEKKDVVVMISYSGSGLMPYKEDLKYFAEKEVSTVLITANRKLKNFDSVICYPMIESPEENAATFYSTEASAYITNCIYSLLFAMDYEDAKEEKLKIDRKQRKKIKE